MVLNLIHDNLGFNTLIIVQIITILQGLIFSLFLIKEYNRTNHLFYLGLTILFYSLDSLPNFLKNIGLINKFPFLLLFPFDFAALSISLLYTYIVKIPELKKTSQNFTILRIGISFTIINFILFMFPLKSKILIIESFIYNAYKFIEAFFTPIALIILLKILKKNKKELNEQYYENEYNELRWAYKFTMITVYFILSYLIILVATYIINFFKLINNNSFSSLEIIANIIDLIFLYTLIIYGLKHKYFQSLYRNYAIQKQKNQIKNISNEEKEYLQSIINKLSDYLISTKIYKNVDFSLTDASQGIKIHPKKISQALNLLKNQNFNSYINQYRIKEAQLLLNENTHKEFTIDGIGNLVGFNSKSVFYKEFKKITGSTPLAYLEHSKL